MFKNLIISLWNDESGAVIATEYLMLGSIVAAGGASGMVAMRDSVVDEYKEFGSTVREVRQAYTPPLKGTKASHPRLAQGNPLETNVSDAPYTLKNNGIGMTP